MTGTTWHGIWTVASLELRQRARTSRWKVVLLVWFLALAGLFTLTYFGLTDNEARAGRSVYDLTIFFVLGMSLLVVPSLTSTSVNGDREHGVLATLQTTLLTSGDIILGKLLASWVVTLVLTAVTLPFLVLGWISGGVGWSTILTSLVMLVLVLLAVCTLGLMFSTLTARTVASVVLTYLTVAGLVLGTVVTFFLSFPLVSQPETVKYYGIPDSYWAANTTPPTDPSAPETGKPEEVPQPTASDCRHLTREQDLAHTERTWWLLAANPFVIVADAAPRGALRDNEGEVTPLYWISVGSRAARAGADVTTERQECWYGSNDMVPQQNDPLQAGPVWPWGLGLYAVAAVGAVAVAIRRVRTPIVHLPNGTRIA